jgi:type I restriction enzyme, R subunit
MKRFADSMIEESALEWFRELGYTLLPEDALKPVGIDPWRNSDADVVLSDALRSSLRRLNPCVPEDSLREAYRTLLAPCEGDLLFRNRAVWRRLVGGIDIPCPAIDGTLRHDRVRVIDFDSPSANDWIVASNFSISSGGKRVVPDVVVFVNGIPLAVLEIKFLGAGGGAHDGIEQLIHSQREVPRLFDFNAVVAVADGVNALLGPIGAHREGYRAWRSVSGEALARGVHPELQTLIRGVFDHSRFLKILRHFISFEDQGHGELRKWVASYYQFHAANIAVQETLRAMAITAEPSESSSISSAESHGGRFGDRRIGVVWHATGSGRSMTTLLYARCLLDHPQLANVAIIILSDRVVLESQMHDYFQHFSTEALPLLDPVSSRGELRRVLARMERGVLFSTIQKFFSKHEGVLPEIISERYNLVVIANDAHRSQQGAFGQAVRAALPNAAFIGFTGIPLHLTERNSQEIFGNYISVYDVQRAVEDGVSVPIYYEARQGPERSLKENAEIAEAFDVALRDEFDEPRPPVRMGAFEAVLTSATFVEALARDIVGHFEKRRETVGGKAMVACMSRYMSVALYQAITRLRPLWRDRNSGGITAEVVISEHYNDPGEWRAIVPREVEELVLSERFRDPKDSFSLVIVCDKWLTGFDVPVLSTLYVCKLMRGHVLLQAVSRLMRPFPGKHGGLIVDYLDLTREIREAFAAHWERGAGNLVPIDLESVIAQMRAQYQVCLSLMSGFDWSRWSAGIFAERAHMLPAAQDYVLSRQVEKPLRQAAAELWRTFALVVTNEAATQIREDVGFFLALRAALNVTAGGERGVPEEMEPDVRKYLAQVVPPDTFADVFHAAGLVVPPNSDVLSEETLEQIERMPYQHLAFRVTLSLIRTELRQIGRRNLATTRSFAGVYNQQKTFDELLALARELHALEGRGAGPRPAGG